jgi:hypothetical protein
LALRICLQSELPTSRRRGAFARRKESAVKRARVIVLGIAIVAALGASWITKKIVSGPREVREVEKMVGETPRPSERCDVFG